MAKVLNPLMSQEAKGSLGAMTFSMWHGMPTVRGKATPARRMRPVQTLNRARLGFLARQWGTLTEINRGLWRVWASNHPQSDGFGGTFLMTGEQAFIMMNQVAVRAFSLASGLLVPPLAGVVSGVATLTLTQGAVAAGFVVSWTALAGNIVGDKFEIGIAGPFQSPGKIAVEGKFRLYNSTTGIVLTTPVTGQQASAWYFARVRYTDSTGQVSAWVQDQIQAHA
jgi:hypothetical protein